ncbi:alpha-L-rhamnosidase protein [Coleophoma cylindrospora]|uniref:Alpha-L-rhamnosidase protein n=1 Tax=Coleophoma cylindrospora TaxID=1849047 RepID=A0A3D8SP11_9HELO|nr:alpha-L-rhamnosidase protein [Coleophoma cylindrospora]
MLILCLAIVVTALVPPLSAQSCWRDTVCTGPAQASFSGPWDRYNYSPPSRRVKPARILSSSNDYISGFPSPAILSGNGSVLVFDFAQEVGGIVTVAYSAQGHGSLGLAFTESKNWTGEWSDDSNGSFGPDGALYANITSANGSYTMPDAKLRGGFRYLSLFLLTNSSLTLDVFDITLEISFQPTWSNLRAYGGYFYSSDETLNRIWYAGAYTLQTNAISPGTGREYPLVSEGWMNDANLGSSASSVFIDGSKRDRTIWSGDLGVAVPSILVSTGDDVGVRNTLQVQFDFQKSTGEFPMAGPPLNFYGSDPYHMSTMIAYHDYILQTNDMEFLNTTWDKYKLAMTFVIQKIDSTGLFYCTGANDWGRSSQGGHNSEANMLMYRTLVSGSSLATWAGQPDLSVNWDAVAETLKTAVNSPKNNWDASFGAFKDSDVDASIHPQDGNSLALLYNGTLTNRTASISAKLMTNWNDIGAAAPELPNNICGFTSSLEVMGHLAAKQSTRALNLIRLSWGWYLNNPLGTNSSAIEGYAADGSFGYRATTGYSNDLSYTSHAHGWSTGPVSALINYVVGITLTSPGGKTWALKPQFGDLDSAQGGFTTPLGMFSASWSLMANNSGLTLSYDMPMESSGLVSVPVPAGSKAIVILDSVNVAYSYDHSIQAIELWVGGGAHELFISYD